MGDVLFALVNLSRHVKVDAEGALRRTIDKFVGRFAHVEARVKAEHGGWGGPSGKDPNLSLEVLDRYWEEAKAKAAEAAKKRAEQLGKAQDRAVENYKREKGMGAPSMASEAKPMKK